MALLTVADIGVATRMTLTTGTADYDLAAQIVSRIESYLAEEISALFVETEMTERYQADYDGIISLNFRPISEVESVATIAGATRTGWVWDGIDEVDGFEAHEVVDITYTAGYSSVPVALKSVAIAAAAREMFNPEGKRQITVGAISETFAATVGDSGSIYFTPSEQRVIDKYRITSTTYRLGPRSTLWRNILPTL